jgi:hypothetical protein
MRELFAMLKAEDALWWGADYWPALAALRGDDELAARLLGYADAIGERTRKVRGALPQKVHDRVRAALLARHDAGWLAARIDEGRLLNDDDVERLLT